jgi:antitoxin YefM
VLLPLREYEAMMETLYLLRGENGRVLRQRLADMEAGANVSEHELIDVEDTGES